MAQTDDVSFLDAAAGQLGEFTKQILSFYVPLALKLPSFRDSEALMHATVKAEAASGITDVVTEADKTTQQSIKDAVAALHPDWQFWGEEGDDNTSEYDPDAPYLLVTDPIEGTNNFRSRLDDQWGSVVAVVDTQTKAPVIGIVAHPAKRLFYVGIQGGGAHVLRYGEDGVLLEHVPLAVQPGPGYENFTYNNSPHFSEALTNQVERFFGFGAVQPDTPGASDMEKSRKTVVLADGVTFEDPESGALEAVRNRGTIYFKTSNEMAAVFVILQEIGGKVTDGQGNPWTLGINTLIAARTQADYAYLFGLYQKCLS
ncbi:MAG TPA: inositol monophosphatase family protein [Candidatus Saccharimonadales bacterium]|nr:inositol monophosphatase family protein [Candidatus Saccharimonadales bacterium]